jgi:hypothetical protein
MSYFKLEYRQDTARKEVEQSYRIELRRARIKLGQNQDIARMELG